jgi:hypothetical protein
MGSATQPAALAAENAAVDGCRPEVGDRVSVAVADGRGYQATVAASLHGVLSLTAPNAPQIPFAPELPDVQPGAGLLIAFVRNRVRYTQQAQLVGLSAGDLRWLVRPIGVPQAQTRRRFVRGGGGGPVQLWRPNDGQLAIREGTVLDLSEGGLRGRVPRDVFVCGESVQVRAWFDGEPMQVVGEILTVRPCAGAPSLDVVVEYSLPESVARQLRRYLFAWEAAQRRHRLNG